MKNQAEKFDHLPQDFDRIAIWDGVVRPKRPFLLRVYYWGILVAIIGLSTSVIVYTKGGELSAIRENVTTVKEEIVLAENGIINHEKNIPASVSLKPVPELEVKDKVFPSLTTATIETNAHSDQRIVESAWITKGNIGEETSTHSSQYLQLNSIQYLNKIIDSEMENVAHASIPLRIDGVNIGLMEEVGLFGEQSKKNHRLGLHAGVGRHRSQFSSTNEEEAIWRSNLEETQIDYAIGLRYEYETRRHFLFSFSGNYQLYKDKINETYPLDSLGQGAQIDYQLYNHYSVFSGHLELGKRMHQRGFFWDFMGGVGLTIKQISELDYITLERELASEAEIEQLYSPSANVFLSAQAALGKRVNDWLFVRIGTQGYSGINLTSPDAKTQHRVVPINAFLEAGIRF